jgi:hypothetical protein
MANNVIQLKRSTTPGNTPSQLLQGELAVNLADNRLFTKNGSNTIIDVFGQSVNTTANVQFNKLTVLTDVSIGGNLTINGANVTINAGQLTIADEIITLNSDQTGTPTTNVGILVNRGSESNVSFVWDETTDRWAFDNSVVVGNLEVTGSLSVGVGQLTVSALVVNGNASVNGALNISESGIHFSDGSIQAEYLDPIVYAIALG